MPSLSVSERAAALGSALLRLAQTSASVPTFDVAALYTGVGSNIWLRARCERVRDVIAAVRYYYTGAANIDHDVRVRALAHLDAFESQANEAAISCFVALNIDLPKQRSPGWHRGKIETPHVGGSEVAAVMGRDKYKTRDAVIRAKASATVPPHYAAPVPGQTRPPPPAEPFGGIACHWGSLFEPVIEAYVAAEHATTLHATDLGSVPGLRHHRYSADGVGMFEFWDAPDAVAVAFPGEDPPMPDARRVARCTLVEFKCPYQRFPRPDVPANYLPQVLMGIHTVVPAEMGLYIEAVYRKCAWHDLGFGPAIDREYHGATGLRRWSGARAYGVIAVWAPPPERLTRAERAVLARAAYSEHGAPDEAAPGDAYAALIRTHGPLDLGVAHYSDFGGRDYGGIMALIDAGVCVAQATRSVRPGDAPLRDDELWAPLAAAPADADRCCAPVHPPELLEPYGFIPWKLMEIAYHPVLPDPDFVVAAGAEIEKAIDIVHRSRQAADPAAAVEELLQREAAAPALDPRDFVRNYELPQVQIVSGAKNDAPLEEAAAAAPAPPTVCESLGAELDALVAELAESVLNS